MVVFVAALLGPELGMFGLIPFGLLLAFSTDSDEAEARRSVILTPRNLALAAAMVAAFGWFWLWHLDLAASTLVAIAGALIALPLALQESAADEARERTVVVTKRSLILGLMGLVTFAYVYQDRGVWLFGLAAVCVVLPLVLAASRAWGARRGQIELGLLRHPLRRELRAHLVQGTQHLAVLRAARGSRCRRRRALRADRVLLERRPVRRRDRGLRRRPGPAGGAGARPSPARLRGHQRGRGPAVGFLALQLVPISVPPADAVVLDSPLAGEWFVQNGGRSSCSTATPRARATLSTSSGWARTGEPTPEG